MLHERPFIHVHLWCDNELHCGGLHTALPHPSMPPCLNCLYRFSCSQAWWQRSASSQASEYGSRCSVSQLHPMCPTASCTRLSCPSPFVAGLSPDRIEAHMALRCSAIGFGTTALSHLHRGQALFSFHALLNGSLTIYSSPGIAGISTLLLSASLAGCVMIKCCNLRRLISIFSCLNHYKNSGSSRAFDALRSPGSVHTLHCARRCFRPSTSQGKIPHGHF
jgi:hypothetical protein